MIDAKSKVLLVDAENRLDTSCTATEDPDVVIAANCSNKKVKKLIGSCWGNDVLQYSTAIRRI